MAKGHSQGPREHLPEQVAGLRGQSGAHTHVRALEEKNILTPKHKKKTVKAKIECKFKYMSVKQNMISSSLVITFSMIKLLLPWEQFVG